MSYKTTLKKKSKSNLAFRFRSAPQSFRSNRLESLIAERKDIKYENVASHSLLVLQNQG